MFDALSVLVLLMVCALSLFREGWSLALVMSMFAFEQVLQASLPIFTQIPALGNIIVGVVVLGAAFRSSQLHPRPFVGYANAGWLFCILIFAFAATSLLWTPSLATAWPLTRWGLPYFVLFIILAPLLISDMASVAKFLTASLILGTIVACLIIFNPKFTVHLGRLGISLDALVRSNPLAMGEIAGCIMILSVLWRGSRLSPLALLIRCSALLIGTLLCLQSGSRGQLVFAVLIAVCLYPLSVRLKSAWTFLGTALALLFVGSVLAWLVPQVLGFQEISRWDAGSLEGGVSVRLQNVWDILGVFLVSPVAWIIGLGFNAFAGITTASSEPYSHVLFIDILAEQGLLAFVCLVLFLWCVQRDLRKLWKMFSDAPVQRSSLASLLGLFLYQLLIVNKQGYLWASLSFFLLGILIIRLRIRVDEGIDPLPAEFVSGDFESSQPAEEFYVLSPDQ